MTAALGAPIENIKTLLDHASPAHLHLDFRVLCCAIEGDIKSKNGAERVKALTLSKYPVFFKLDEANKYLNDLVTTHKLITPDDPNLNEIRAALHVGETILRYYVRDILALINLRFIPDLAGLVRGYIDL